MRIGRREFLRSASLVTIVVATGLSDEFLSTLSRKVVLGTTPIEQLGMGVRLTNALKANRITTVGQLASTSQDDLLSIRLVGRCCIGEIREKLVEKGFLSPASAARTYPDGLLIKDLSLVRQAA
jgi:DNA-directed RNA polymerase subunit alpha